MRSLQNSKDTIAEESERLDKIYSGLYARGYGSGPVGSLLKWSQMQYAEKTVLDCGCGNAVLRRKIACKHYTGIDVSRLKIAQLQQTASDNETFLWGNLASVSLPNARFDYAWCSDVLEHIPEDLLPNVMGNICRVADYFIGSISCRPSVIVGQGGEPLHETVRSPCWWLAWLRAYIDVEDHQTTGLALFVKGALRRR